MEVAARPEQAQPVTSQPIVPPAPRVHAKPLSPLRFVFELSRNSLGIWADSDFERLITRRRVLGTTTVIVSDPEGVRHVLGAAASHYERLVIQRRLIRPIGGDGLFLAEGAKWRQQRRVLAPLFTPAKVALLLPHFACSAEELVREVEGHSRVDLSLAFQQATLDAVLRALFSMPDRAHRDRLGDLVRLYISGPGRPNAFDGLAQGEVDFAFATTSRRRFQQQWFIAVDQLVAERRRAGTPVAQRDMLDLLLAARDGETGEALSDEEVRDQSATMLLAGYETTARTLFWAAYLLALDQAEQACIRTETTAFPMERIATLDDLSHWPRLRQTLLEALRLYPPAPELYRACHVADEVMGEAIKPGDQVWISPWVIHRHRKFWDHPTAFVPDRFAGKTTPWTSGTFLPFGAGPRFCIGAAFAMAEAQIMLAALLTRFSIALDDPRPVQPIATFTTAPHIEPMFRLEPV